MGKERPLGAQPDKPGTVGGYIKDALGIRKYTVPYGVAKHKWYDVFNIGKTEVKVKKTYTTHSGSGEKAIENIESHPFTKWLKRK